MLDFVKRFLLKSKRTNDSRDFIDQRISNSGQAVCSAPFKSIRFEPRGIVRTCCYNVEVVLGRYPQMSIREMWESQEANNLRQKISEGDFGMGCRLCEKQIQNKEFETVKLLQYDNLPSSVDGYPLVIDFSMHNTCNLECIMCHGEYSSSIRKNREKLHSLPMHYDEEFVSQLEEFIPYASQFVFAGGEPFLIDIHYAIWGSINKLNPSADISIVTNGTVLNERVKKVLEGGNYHLTVSTDSFQETTYEKIRINASFQNVTANVEYFRKYCAERGTQFAFNICPIKENKLEIPKMIRFCSTNGIKSNLLNVVYPPSSSLQSLNAEELTELIYEYSKEQFPEHNEIEKYNARQFKDLQNRLAGWLETMEIAESAELLPGEYCSFDDLASVLLKKALQYSSKIVDGREVEVKSRIKLLRAQYREKKVPIGRLKEMDSISSERIYVMLAGLDIKDLKLVVENHYL